MRTAILAAFATLTGMCAKQSQGRSFPKIHVSFYSHNTHVSKEKRVGLLVPSSDFEES